jgi:glycine dehydrogenase subunit 1
MRYFAHAKETIDEMLRIIGITSLEDLFSSIPPQERLKAPLDLEAPLDELALKRQLKKFLTPLSYRNFLGAGATTHFVPEWISQQLLRAEWYTSYTPYQPEASQGTLQAIFEFQSMVASLFGQDIANASMYDGATALMEALLMAIRTTGKKTVLLCTSIHPEYRQTAKTYLDLGNFSIIEVGFGDEGSLNLAEFSKTVDNVADLAAIAIQSPNFFGAIENIDEVFKIAHDHQALLIAITTDVSANAILEPMGNKADIVIGEGLGFLGNLHLGGPGVGLLASKKNLARQMPGRLVGKTTDKFGLPGYTLTLSTREQHIRREKATSNICTNHNLMALAFSMAMSAYGRSGLLNLAKTNLKKTIFFRKILKDRKVDIAFTGHHYNETVVRLKNIVLLQDRLVCARRQKMIAGLPLGKFYPELASCLLIATTELHEDDDLILLADILAGEIHD